MRKHRETGLVESHEETLDPHSFFLSTVGSVTQIGWVAGAQDKTLDCSQVLSSPNATKAPLQVLGALSKLKEAVARWAS